MQEERIFVVDLAPGMAVDEVFVVRQKELRTTRKGDYYISATLGDRTGGVPGRMWQATESIFESIPLEGFLRVRGRVEDYKGAPQIIIDACRPVPPEKVHRVDFLPVTPFDIEEMWSELLEILRNIKSAPIRGLIKKFVEDKDLVAAFKESPAAVQMHHPYVGGLLEHTLNIARAAMALLPMYPQLNRDLVLAGVFLHDIGKSAELSGGLSIHYTDEGQLVGHITLASLWVQEKARLWAEELGEEFPHDVRNVLLHIILAHHGVHEYGSPKLPAVPEAFFLHYLDNLDAKMYMTAYHINNDADTSSRFTGWVGPLQTRLYKASNDLPGSADAQQGPLFES